MAYYKYTNVVFNLVILYNINRFKRKLFLSVAGGRTHIGTYVGVSPSPASNENNFFYFILRFARYPQIYNLLCKNKIGSYPQFCEKSIV